MNTKRPKRRCRGGTLHRLGGTWIPWLAVGCTTAYLPVTMPAQAATGTAASGACCFSDPCLCVPAQLPEACALDGGTHFGAGSVCELDPCRCLQRACCDATGVCLGDRTRELCESAGHTWHSDASCQGAGNRPRPTCNRFDVNNCHWDNGLPLNDGGACRTHTHAGGMGQPPRYDFNAADDFMLRGGDAAPCAVSHIRSWMRMRPAGLDGAATPWPPYDWEGLNLTIFASAVSPQTGLEGPAGYGLVPADGMDLNPKRATEPGGIVYTRHFRLSQGAVNFSYQGGSDGELGPFCDPPPANGLETEHVFRVDVVVDPPILLSKNTRYWLGVQGVFPFNDGLRDTLQSWWMPSEHNTGLRGVSQRTGSADYLPTIESTDGGSPPVPIWVPNNMDLVPPGYPPNPGNSGTCPGAPPARTRYDFAFQIDGTESVPAVPNDRCQDALEVFDGSTTFVATGAETDGPDSGCGSLQNDLWFRYTATCNGLMTVDTCGSTFDAAVALYLDPDCDPLGPELNCSETGCAEGVTTHTFVRETVQVLIRVAGAESAKGPFSEGMGILTVRCEETCGSPSRGDCCLPHDPEVACSNERCCNIVCSIPGEEVCCDDPTIGWDAECAAVASDVPACRCPCLFECPLGAEAESESCATDANGGCPTTQPGTAAYSDLGTLHCGSTRTVCGTVYAANGTRDTDWWKFRVVGANANTEAEIHLELKGSAPVGVLILKGSQSPYCDENADGQPDDLVVFDSVATAGCQTRTLSACVPADADGEDYVVFVSTFETSGDDGLGNPIFNGFPCTPELPGNRNHYTFTIGCSPLCQWGACCTCPGGCADGLTEPECIARQGKFVGEGTVCAAMPVEASCAKSAHGCTQAVPLACGQTLDVDLTIPSKPPDEPFPCAIGQESVDDSAWYSFVVPPGVASARIHTCESTNPGRDSILAVYHGGCCQQSDPLEVLGCSDDACGFTDRLSSLCLGDLIPGETYFIQVSNAGPSGGEGRYRLSLECPCTGSCCDGQAGTCNDHIVREECHDPLRFSDQLSCATLNPRCGVGACCAADGTCSEVAAEDCTGCALHWPAAVCSEVFCNHGDACRFATAGDLRTDQAPFGFQSQYARDSGLFQERADDFILHGCPEADCTNSELCPITIIEYTVFHSAHDTVNGCRAGGGEACTDTPADYEGIVVTLFDETGSTGNGPMGGIASACVPQCTGQFCDPGIDGDYHDGPGCRWGRVFGPAEGESLPEFGSLWSYSVHTQPSRGSVIRLSFDPPLMLERNHMYWLAVAHLLPESGYYQVMWQASNSFNGNFAFGYHSQGSGGFVPSESTRNDMLFDVRGPDPEPGCGPCRLYGDLVPGMCRIDVDDLLCVVDGFTSRELCPAADQFPCGGNGIIDVDDILAELAAFSGYFECPHPCPGGACCAAFSEDRADLDCRDMNYYPGGMSRTDCNRAGGTYYCDGSTCPRAECP